MLGKELGKMLKNAAFYVAIAAVVVILMAGCIYRSPSTGQEYTVFDFLFSENRDSLISESGLTATDIIVEGMECYLDMFLPIIVAVPFVMLVCGEKKNSTRRFEICRTGKTGYAVGKYMAAMIVGGFILLAGYILFGIILSAVMPGGTGAAMQYKKEFILESSSAAEVLYRTFGIYGLCMLKCIRMFFYGAFIVLPAFGMSAVTRNRYIILSVPFLFFYLLRKFIEKRESAGLRYFLPETIGNVYMTDYIKLAAVFGGVAVLIFIIYRVSIGRKCDCGEE